MYGLITLTGLIFVVFCIALSELHDVLKEIKLIRKSLVKTECNEQDPGPEYWTLTEDGKWEVYKDKLTEIKHQMEGR